MDRWKQAENLFLEAVDLPPEERVRYLEQACAADSQLYEEVESLLAADARNGADIAAAIQCEAQAFFRTPGEPGTRIGAYRILSEIGRGGMGTVFLAVRDDDHFRKQVAIKLIRPGMDTEDLLTRFRHERQILANLDHPYISRLLDGGTTPDGRPFLVMEFVQGEPLDIHCEKHGLDLPTRCRLFLKVCEAVSYAHRNLVVHRDLKPGNVLVDAEGTPKLLDFGVAKLLDPGPASDRTMTQATMRVVTPDYGSPEQILGDRITTTSDVYSLGAILYELLCGLRPHRFTGVGMREVERVICEVEPVRPSEAAPRWKAQIRGDLDAIIGKAMRKEPASRYASVEQFAEDLQRYLDGYAVTARQGDVAYRTRKFLRRNRTAIAAGALFAAVLIGGTAVATIQARRAEMERQRAMASQALAEASQREAQRQAAESERQRGLAEAQRLHAEEERAAAETERQRADRGFDEVRQLSGKFLLDFHDAIADLPGSTPARKMAVETGLKYFDTVVEEAHGNREFLEEIARGYVRLGDVQGNPYEANLGDYAGAMKSYQKAAAIRARITDPSPRFVRDRIAGDTKMAEWIMVRGDSAEGERLLRGAIALGQQGPAAQDYDVRSVLTRSYYDMGDLKYRVGLVSQSIEPYLKGVEIWTELAKVGRDPGTEQYGLGVGHSKLCDMYTRLERAPQAIGHIRKALEIDIPLAKANPNNRKRQRKVYLDYMLLANVASADSGTTLVQEGEARAAMVAAVEITERIAAADPNDARAVSDLRSAQEFLGDVLRREHDPEGALVHYQRALELVEMTAASGPKSLTTKEALVMAHHRVARGLVDAGRPDEALDHLRQADLNLAEARKESPTPTRWDSWQGDVERARGLAYAARKSWPEAIAAYRAAIAVSEAATGKDPSNDDYWNDLRLEHFELADCYAALGRWSDAAQAIEGALDGFQKIAARRALRADEQESRKSALSKLADWKGR
jgi:tetratricopeptide (TPR) repeat protein